MASITSRGRKYIVRWRDPDGQQRTRTAPSLRAAKALQIEVEEACTAGKRWEPPKPGELPDLPAIHRAFLVEASRLYAESTVYRYGVILDVWEAWLRERISKRKRMTPDLLSRRLLGEHYDWLLSTGLHGRPRSPSTAAKHISYISVVWRWAADDDDFGDHVPRPRSLRLPAPAGRPTRAPTWAEMDAVIRASSGPQQKLAIVLRCTGLRVQQAMGLRWSDVDLDRQELSIRGVLGKSRQERQGRIIPLSPHLVAELRSWEREGPELLPSNRQEGPRERKARARDMGAAWERAGVREGIWRNKPHHAFRKGLMTELKVAGADDEAVKYLVGHSLGVRGHYLEAHRLPQVIGAVRMIPPLDLQGEETVGSNPEIGPEGGTDGEGL